MIFKNCESLYCIPVTYIKWYINYASIKKKRNKVDLLSVSLITRKSTYYLYT